MTTESEPAEIEFDGVRLEYPQTDFGLELTLPARRGGILGFLGRSGSGKSTTIKIAAGLIRSRNSKSRWFRLRAPAIFHTGRFLINGKDCGALEPADRRAFLISQHSNLYPHLTIRNNLALLDRNGVAASLAILEELDVMHTLDRFPSQISAGESQRVSLVKAMIAKAAFVLFDEPSSALDLDLKIELLNVLRSFHEKHPATYIFVSHDQDILMSLADTIAVLDKGRILQMAAPELLLNVPEHPIVAASIDPFFRVPLDHLASAEDGFMGALVHFHGPPLPGAASQAVLNTRMLAVQQHAQAPTGWTVEVESARTSYIAGQQVLQLRPKASAKDWMLPVNNGHAEQPTATRFLRIPSHALHLFDPKSRRVPH